MAASKKKKTSKAASNTNTKSQSSSSSLASTALASASTHHKRKTPDSGITLTSEQMSAFQEYLKSKGKKQTQTSATEKKAEADLRNISFLLFYNLTSHN